MKINIARYIDSNNQIYNLKTRKINGSAFNDVAPPQNAAEIHAVTFTDPTNDSIDEQSENVNNSNEKAKPYTGISGKLGEGSRDFNEGRTTKEVVQGKIKADEFIDKVFITVN